MYDMFRYECVCNKEAESQTKLFDNWLDIYRVGSRLGKLNDKKTYNLRLKNPCYHCGKHAVVIVVNGMIKGFSVSAEPTVYEHPFGGYNFDGDEGES